MNMKFSGWLNTVRLVAVMGMCINFSVSADVPAQVQAVFQNNGCNSSNCHSGAGPDAGLGLDDAATSELELVNVDSELAGCTLKRVSPGDAANSVLYDKISNTNPQCGAAMPLGGPQISTADQETIFNWIESLPFGLIEMASAGVSVQETDSSVTLRVNRSQGTMGSVTVDYSVAAVTGDTATSPDDFIADSGTLVFADGVDSQTIAVTLMDDDVYEGAEVFSVTLSNATGGASVGGQAQSKVTIVDNEFSNQPGTFFFDRVNYSVDENGTSFDLTVLRSFGAAGQVTVDLSTIAGTATSDSDYQNVSQTLVFDEGVQSALVTINIIDDQETEGNESFNLRLSNPTNGATVGTPDTVSVTITDDESSDTGDGSDDGEGDGQDDDDSGTSFEQPETEEFEAAGSLFWITPFLALFILISRKSLTTNN
ncbi:Calx-beta domain-containing protein [Aliikangiella sp. G2MR2-5]|uniref:Calx-beta domain-containing protein n=1 Tax=Aliikangiella sp. G2MR2-5 TaxID=2788943 RepID=UPI0018AB1AD4|nr:Calx-beta domain-containing protein [Aliikangiella sp. G2MR2-5]